MNLKFKTYRWVLNSRAALAFGLVLAATYTTGLIYFGDQWFLSLFEGNKVVVGCTIGCLLFTGYLAQSVTGWWITKILNLETMARNSISIFIGGSMISVYLSLYIAGLVSLLAIFPNKIDLSIYNDLFFSDEHLIVILIAHYVFTFGYTLLFRDPTIEVLEVYKESTTVLKPLSEIEIAPNESSIISIKTDTAADGFELDLKSFVYARAEGNYTDVFIQNEAGDIKKETKRILISNLNQQVEDSGPATPIFRTHKSFLVNLVMIESFQGNSNGLKIFLRLNYLQEIPVSRANVSSFKNKLEDLDLVKKPVVSHNAFVLCPDAV